ncbi:MAG TPA: hypothetical protein VI260_15520 [Blastocatellia bacterium]|jgi:hypothetical protein
MAIIDRSKGAKDHANRQHRQARLTETYIGKESQMNKLLIAPILIVFCIANAYAQKGAAEPDYYPMGYNGDTWTGEVTATDDSKREITLSYKKKDKEETFVGALEEGYAVKMKDGSMRELKVSEIPTGTRIKVYYITKTKKDASGAKTKFNQIIKIRFLPKEG